VAAASLNRVIPVTTSTSTALASSAMTAPCVSM
jgi:hypothetical protein